MNLESFNNEIMIHFENFQFQKKEKSFDMSIKYDNSTSYRHIILEFLLENFSVFQHLFPLTKSWILVIFVAWTIGKPQDQIWFFNIQLPYHLTPHFCLVM